ncbi:MAG: hypothetical protein IPK60_00270 [Sandaracinaceae bacterium]|nr:hypothetical protein [Sandaracinaceae bacterium]
MRVLASCFLLGALCLGGSSRALAQQEVPPPPVVIVEQSQMPTTYGAVEVQAGPGYAYGPQGADPNWVGARMQELNMLELQYSQYSMALPITLTVLGGVTFTISGLVYLAVSGLCDAFDSSCSQERLGWGLATLAGGVVLTVGIVTMLNTISARRPYGLRMRQIRTELRNAGVQVAWGVAPTQYGATAGLTVSF